MARETKAQRIAREEAEAQVRLEEEIRTYPLRLMTILERASNANFELTVVDRKFFLVDRDDREDAFELSIAHDRASEAALWDLDWRINIKEESERKARELRELREAALAKLTKEERKALDL